MDLVSPAKTIFLAAASIVRMQISETEMLTTFRMRFFRFVGGERAGAFMVKFAVSIGNVWTRRGP
jgi:hypothetical protein